MGDERERMAQDIESYRRERKKLLAKIEGLRDENARLRALLAEHVSGWCARRHTYDDPPCGDCLPCRTREAVNG